MSVGSISSPEHAALIEAVHEQWSRDPNSVDPSWRFFCEGLALGLGSNRPRSGEQTNITRLIVAYRQSGHHLANLDPLSAAPTEDDQLKLSLFNFTDRDFDTQVDASFFQGLQRVPLRELLTALKQTYCGTIGVEQMHIEELAIRKWLQDRMEPNRNRPRYNREQKIDLLKALYYARKFENFIHAKYPGEKRFSLEGGETLLPMVETLVQGGPAAGVEHIVIGMAHRGRLNVLTNILRKPYEEIFAQFEKTFLPEENDGDGDVKYHLGFSSDRETGADRKFVHVTLTPNPSHLEIVNSVVEGRVRAKQTFLNDAERKRVLPLLIHGDASFAGQGPVFETLQLSQLEGYRTGGTIHIVVNNQVGFTTDPSDARSTKYCTDLAKFLQVPIFHVNAEDPEACVHVMELALAFRQQWHLDVVVDLVCYRKYGHNEGDEPTFTQPKMYAAIAKRPSVNDVYSDRLVAEGVMTATDVVDLNTKFDNKLAEAQSRVLTSQTKEYPVMHGFAQGPWAGIDPDFDFAPVTTGASADQLRLIAERLNEVPSGFAVHPTIDKQMKGILQAVRENKSLNWGPAELLAYGSLLLEGTPVRLTGQDCRRGTFSHRHAVLYDQATGRPHSALQNLSATQAPFQIYNSPLSEAACLGFEYGYALDAPQTLVMWEAQFGDFANGAQVVIDQFIAAGKSKWDRDNGVVLLLPHGYEGSGPEHSSARLERFLQLCGDENIQVCNPSTPGQHFHLLRRQMKRKFRKPLVVMTPKSLLRLEACVSPLQELISGSFHEVLDDPAISETKPIRRVVLCSGKVYWDLLAERTRLAKTDVALLRIEQFYPLNQPLLQKVLERYRTASEWFWVQEEPQNNGGWFFIEPALRKLGCNAAYIGRDASASPATGSPGVHKKEQAAIVEAAILGHGKDGVSVVAPGQSGYRALSPSGNGQHSNGAAVIAAGKQ